MLLYFITILKIEKKYLKNYKVNKKNFLNVNWYTQADSLGVRFWKRVSVKVSKNTV